MNSQNLSFKKKFNLSKRQLFEAWSNPKIMERWFFGDKLHKNCCTVENQFITKGKFRIVMHFEQTGDSELFGEYLEIERYNKIAFTWTNSLVSETIVTLLFKQLSPNTSELILEHTLFPDESTKNLHNQGWDQCLNNLEIIINQELILSELDGN